MYYIEEIDKPNFFEKLFNIVRMQDNRIFIPIGEEKADDKKENKKNIKLAQRTKRIIEKLNSNKIILSKNLYQNETYKNLLYTYGYDIEDGKWLFEALTCKILDYIIANKKLKKEELQIAVLVNDLKEYTLENIKILSKEYKSINIVTNHIEKFKKLENMIYDESGLSITVSNNKKKSLLKSNIILNIDFPNELINKYNICDEAIIVNIYNDIKINKKRFNGEVVNDYEIIVKNDVLQNFYGNNEKYYMKHLYEAEFYKSMPFVEVQKRIKDDIVEVKELYCNNSII